jgi:hypothetical protein
MFIFIFYVLPILLVLLECFFMRYCVTLVDEGLRHSEYEEQVSEGHKIPRIQLALLLFASFIPGVGALVFLITTGIIVIRLSSDEFDIDYFWVIRETRFTKYWLKS